jgi:hypothetical protein
MLCQAQIAINGGLNVRIEGVRVGGMQKSGAGLLMRSSEHKIKGRANMTLP